MEPNPTTDAKMKAAAVLMREASAAFERLAREAKALAAWTEDRGAPPDGGNLLADAVAAAGKLALAGDVARFGAVDPGPPSDPALSLTAHAAEAAGLLMVADKAHDAAFSWVNRAGSAGDSSDHAAAASRIAENLRAARRDAWGA